MVQLAILTAILLVMTVTPLGYLRIGLLEITFLVIPVVIGAVRLGPVAGAFLGFVFGITSFAQCTTNALGMVMLGESVVYTFITCVVTRVLVGLIPGFIAKGLNKIQPESKNKKRLSEVLTAAIPCAAAPLLNTLFFMSCLYFFFGRLPDIQSAFGNKTFFAFVFGAVTVNSLVELAACLLIGTSVCLALNRALKK